MSIPGQRTDFYFITPRLFIISRLPLRLLLSSWLGCAYSYHTSISCCSIPRRDAIRPTCPLYPATPVTSTKPLPSTLPGRYLSVNRRLLTIDIPRHQKQQHNTLDIPPKATLARRRPLYPPSFRKHPFAFTASLPLLLLASQFTRTPARFIIHDYCTYSHPQHSHNLFLY